MVCLDNLITGRASNLDSLLERPGFQFIQHDIIEELPPLDHVERVYHLASPASPIGYRKYPIETLRANSEGTRRLSQLAANHGARFLFASTSEIYGDPLVHPQPESYWGNVNPNGPRSMYDEAKRYGEAFTLSYAQTSGLDGRIVRIFNTYGPNSDPFDGRMVPNFLTRALQNHPITIYGTGHQTRSLCYVSDLVEGLVRAMEWENTSGQAVNLGNPEEHSVLEYAHLVREMTGSRSEIVFACPAVGDDPQRRCPDISKARDLLQWNPEVSLATGLRRTIDAVREDLLSRGLLDGLVPSLGEIWAGTSRLPDTYVAF